MTPPILGVTPPILGIVGPTASGKTELAMAVARRTPVEILVADSRQVYRGMDIGTAKPSDAQRAEVPHHLLDVADPDEAFTVADWVARARDLIPRIAGAARAPLLVGGTGLYVSALLEGHRYGSDRPEDALRRRLRHELEAGGLDALARRLAEAAPDVARSIDPRNPRRVIRALERLEVGGPPPDSAPYAGTVTLIGLDRPRDTLYRRIDERARGLFAGGLLDEVAALVRAGYGPELPPMTGHGYAEAMRYLAGEWTLERAIEVTARRTRQYAKRQLTWFRRQLQVTWLHADERAGDDVTLVAQAVEAFERGSGTHRLP